MANTWARTCLSKEQGAHLNFRVFQHFVKTCLSKEREAHLNFRVFRHFVKTCWWLLECLRTFWVSVCHWIVLSFSVHTEVFYWQVTPWTDLSLSLSFSELNFSDFPVMSRRSFTDMNYTSQNWCQICDVGQRLPPPLLLYTPDLSPTLLHSSLLPFSTLVPQSPQSLPAL